jgi:3-deoxy-7-phosphoheptulonate synthase
MIVVMRPGANQDQITGIIAKAEQMGLRTHPIYGDNRTVIALVGDLTRIDREIFEVMPGVLQVMRIQEPYKLANRNTHPDGSLIELQCGRDIGPVIIGGNEVIVMAGPCSVESRDQIVESAIAMKAAGAKVLRGGAFKPRTSPYDFQGLGEEGLKYLAEAREITGLPVITEVMNVEQVPMVADYADILQIGARNMQNFGLLQAVGKVSKPVMLKRGISGMIKELLMCAEYIMSGGNGQVMLCERGIRTYETATRNTFDLNAIPVLKQSTHLPIIADPSHGTGLRELVPAMSKAALACGADALIIEVHSDPDKAVSDGRQSLTVPQFSKLMDDLRRIAVAVDRTLGEDEDSLPVNEDELVELAMV